MYRTALTLTTCALLLGSIGGCQTNPATGESQLILVGGSELDAMGAEAAPMLTQEYGGEVPEGQLRRYVSQIGKRVAAEVEEEYGDIKWTFTTLDSDVINAFALPGGRVFISRGLLQQLKNEAEVAAVLGHEIGHVTGRHVDERISRATAIDVGLQLGGAVTESQIANAAANLFGQGYLLHFSRDQELEADRLGLRYMAAAGYDPHAMLGVLRVLLNARDGGTPPEILSTHPDPETRLERVTQWLEEDYGQTRNNPNFKRFEDRFERQAAPHLRQGRARTASLGVLGEGRTPQSSLAADQGCCWAHARP